MTDVTQMTQCHPIHFQEIDGVLAQLTALVSIVPGGDAGDKSTPQLILARAFNQLEFISNSLSIAMAGVEMAQGHYVRLELTQRITQARMAWVSEDNSFLTLDTKTRMT
jgi:hypothetical protein